MPKDLLKVKGNFGSSILGRESVFIGVMLEFVKVFGLWVSH